MTTEELIECESNSPFNVKGSLVNVEILPALRKLKKIEEIIADWENGKFSDAVGCLRVKAVLENGEDN